MPVVALIRDARPDEALALESLQRRASAVWEEYRAQLAAHPDAITPPHRAIAEGRVRVAVDESGHPLGFSVVQPIEDGRCELDDLFVEPDSMRRGVGRLLVDDVGARAAAGGASYVDVIANPNALGFYSRLGFEVTGQASTRFGDAPRMTLHLAGGTSGGADAAAIADVMNRFLRAVSFENGERPSYDDLPDLFLPGARLIRNSGTAPEISTVEEFVRSRRAAFERGELRSFEETELGERTELFGNVTHRFSPYRKRALSDRGAIDVRGAISTQFVRTADGWRISSMAWDDER
jgi:ribosomal protein S18 acetylase RimI-like enzyme